MKIKFWKPLLVIASIFSLLIGLSIGVINSAGRYLSSNKKFPSYDTANLMKLNHDLPVNWTSKDLENEINKYHQSIALLINPILLQKLHGLMNQLNEANQVAYHGLDESITYNPVVDKNEANNVQGWKFKKDKTLEDVYNFFSKKVNSAIFPTWKKLTDFFLDNDYLYQTEQEKLNYKIRTIQFTYVSTITQFTFTKMLLIVAQLFNNNALNNKSNVESIAAILYALHLQAEYIFINAVKDKKHFSSLTYNSTIAELIEQYNYIYQTLPFKITMAFNGYQPSFVFAYYQFSKTGFFPLTFYQTIFNLSVTPKLDLVKNLPTDWFESDVSETNQLYIQQVKTMSNEALINDLRRLMEQLNQANILGYEGFNEIATYELKSINDKYLIGRWVLKEGKTIKDVYSFFANRVSELLFPSLVKFQHDFSHPCHCHQSEAEKINEQIQLMQFWYINVLAKPTYTKIVHIVEQLIKNNAFENQEHVNQIGSILLTLYKNAFWFKHKEKLILKNSIIIKTETIGDVLKKIIHLYEELDFSIVHHDHDIKEKSLNNRNGFYLFIIDNTSTAPTIVSPKTTVNNLEINKNLPINWTQSDLENSVNKYTEEIKLTSDVKLMEQLIDLSQQWNKASTTACDGIDQIISSNLSDNKPEIKQFNEEYQLHEAKMLQAIYNFFVNRTSWKIYPKWSKFDQTFHQIEDDTLLSKEAKLTKQILLLKDSFGYIALQFTFAKMIKITEELVNRNILKNQNNIREITMILSTIYQNADFIFKRANNYSLKVWSSQYLINIAKSFIDFYQSLPLYKLNDNLNNQATIN